MKRPSLGAILVGALMAGALAAVINNGWAMVWGAATGFHSSFATAAAITISSLATCIVGGLLWFGVSRMTRQHHRVMVGAAVVMGLLAVVLGFVNPMLPDGSVKPPGFQGLVQPMHVVVPLFFVLLIPWWVQRREKGAATR